MGNGRWGCQLVLLIAIQLPRVLQKPWHTWAVEDDADSSAVEHDVAKLDRLGVPCEDGRAFQRSAFHLALGRGTESEKNSHGASGLGDHQKDTLACSNHHARREGPRASSAEMDTFDEWESLVSPPRLHSDVAQIPRYWQLNLPVPGTQTFPSQYAQPFDHRKSLQDSEFSNRRHRSTNFGWSESQLRSTGNPIRKFQKVDCRITPQGSFERTLRSDGKENGTNISNGYQSFSDALGSFPSALIGSEPQPSNDLLMPQRDNVPFTDVMDSTNAMGLRQATNILTLNPHSHMGINPMMHRKELPTDCMGKFDEKVAEYQHTGTELPYIFEREQLSNSMLEVRGKRKASIYPASGVLSSKEATIVGSSDGRLLSPNVIGEYVPMSFEIHKQLNNPENYLSNSPLSNSIFVDNVGNQNIREHSPDDPQNCSKKLVDTGYNSRIARECVGPYSFSPMKESKEIKYLQIPNKIGLDEYPMKSDEMEHITSAQKAKINDNKSHFLQENIYKDSNSCENNPGYNDLQKKSASDSDGDLSFLQLRNYEDFLPKESIDREEGNKDLIFLVESIKSSSRSKNLKLLPRGKLWVEEHETALLLNAYKITIMKHHPRNVLIAHKRQLHISIYFFILADQEAEIMGFNTKIEKLIYELGIVVHNKICKKQDEFTHPSRSTEFVMKCMEIVETSTKGFFTMIRLFHSVFKNEQSNLRSVGEHQRGAWIFIERFWKDFELFQDDSIQRYSWLSDLSTDKIEIDADLRVILFHIKKGRSYTLDKKISFKIFAFWMKIYRNTLFHNLCHHGHNIDTKWVQFINDLLLYSSPKIALEREKSSLLMNQFRRVAYWEE